MEQPGQEEVTSPPLSSVAVTQRVQQDGHWRDGDTSFFKVIVRHEA
jgi:hypothetical protein